MSFLATSWYFKFLLLGELFLIAVGCEGKPNHRPGVAALPKQHNQRHKHNKNWLREYRTHKLKTLIVRVLTGPFP